MSSEKWIIGFKEYISGTGPFISKYAQHTVNSRNENMLQFQILHTHTTTIQITVSKSKIQLLLRTRQHAATLLTEYRYVP